MITKRSLQELDSSWLALLACPACHGDLATPSDEAITCRSCQRTYAVVDGIPILLVERDESVRQLEYQRRFFDAQFGSLEDSYRLANWHRSYLERVFASLGVSANSEGYYLDVGAGGTGYTVIESARLGWRSFGCDLSLNGVKKAIQHARSQNLQDRAKFVVCSAEALPFKSGVFNAISCIAVLEHLVRDDLAAAQISRVCASGGRFFVTVPNCWEHTNVLFWLPSWLNDRHHRHLRHYSAKSLARLFDGSFLHLRPARSARLFKGVQLGLPWLRINSDKIWWWLERMDLKNPDSPWGAQLHMTGTRS